MNLNLRFSQHSCFKEDITRINSQSLEDTQIRYILQKYFLGPKKYGPPNIVGHGRLYQELRIFGLLGTDNIFFRKNHHIWIICHLIIPIGYEESSLKMLKMRMIDGDFASFESKIDDRQAEGLTGGASELYFSSVPIRFPNALLQCTRQQ